MVGFPFPEGSAWEIVSRPTLRPAYMHREPFKRLNGPRRSWISRVRRTPDGCWIWSGRYNRKENGELYPVFDCRTRGGPTGGSSGTRHSAFWWMIREWFPNVATSWPHPHTALTCGDYRCVNPTHRDWSKTNRWCTLTRANVLAIYALRDSGRRRSDVAKEFGVDPSSITRIWNGRTWSNVTGHKRENLVQ